MTNSLNPMPVLSGMLDACRDWREWFKGLDNIREEGGITGLVNSNCHWLCLCRRQDLPIEFAAAFGDLSEPGRASAPGDVMCLVKEHMSDSELSQKPFCLLRGGSSMLMQSPRGPAEWEPRNELLPDDVRGLTRLCGKVRKVLPTRSAAASYLEEYMSKPRSPSAPPKDLCLFSHQCCRARQSLGPALSGATQNASVPDDEIRIVSVRRRKPQHCAALNMPLHAWVTFRSSQGVSVETAVQEWNGWHLAARGLGQ